MICTEFTADGQILGKKWILESILLVAMIIYNL